MSEDRTANGSETSPRSVGPVKERPHQHKQTILATGRFVPNGNAAFYENSVWNLRVQTLRYHQLQYPLR